MRLCFIEIQEERPAVRLGREEVPLCYAPRSLRPDRLLFPLELTAAQWPELMENLRDASPDTELDGQLLVNFQLEAAHLHVHTVNAFGAEQYRRFLVRLTAQEREQLAEYFLSVDPVSLGITEEFYRFQRTYAKDYASERFLAALC